MEKNKKYNMQCIVNALVLSVRAVLCVCVCVWLCVFSRCLWISAEQSGRK